MVFKTYISYFKGFVNGIRLPCFLSLLSISIIFTYFGSGSIIRLIQAYNNTIKEFAMINIKPSAAIRKNYNEISKLCRQTRAPVYLTKNGEGDLVVMDLETFARRECMLKLREQLVASEEDRQSGNLGHSIEEVADMMRKAIKEAGNG